MISVVIPTLNARACLDATLAALQEGGAILHEIIIADGGSRDGTQDIALRAGCRVCCGQRGRGGQLRFGAAQATGRWLLFLHADTRLAAGWAHVTRTFIDRAGSGAHAAVFRFKLDDDAWMARLLERIVAARVKALALPYGDQGLLLSREFYHAVGGFSPLPIMEDVDLIRRIGRARFETLPAAAVTSAERYRRDGYVPRVVRNGTCLGLYLAGVSPHRIARLYD